MVGFVGFVCVGELPGLPKSDWANAAIPIIMAGMTNNDFTSVFITPPWFFNGYHFDFSKQLQKVKMDHLMKTDTSLQQVSNGLLAN